MIPGCGGSLSGGTRCWPGSTRSSGRGDRPGRPGLHPGRRRHRQDPRDHPPDRPPRAHRGDLRPARARGHLHRPGRRRDARPARRARACRACRPAPSTPPRCARCATSPPGCWPGGPCRSCWTARSGWSPSPPPGRPADRPGRRPGPRRRDRVGQVVAGRAGGVRGGRGQGAARHPARAGEGGRGLRRVRAAQARATG